MKRNALAGALVLLSGCSDQATSETESNRIEKESEFRRGIMVESLYVEYLGEPYFSSWWGRLEKSEGDWRDVFVETNDKSVRSGILSFRCNGNVQAPVGWIEYQHEFGNESEKSVLQIKFEEFSSWKLGSFENSDGDFWNPPPYELYVVAQAKFC